MTDDDVMETFKIQQLIYKYFDSVNRGDLETMRTLLADDAVWEEPFWASDKILPTDSWSSSETPR
jgi:ketosteroid isomerase-like protein